jgi:hypothetical protein
MASAVDFSTKKLFKVKVWSPVAGKNFVKVWRSRSCSKKNQLVLRQLIRGKN